MKKIPTMLFFVLIFSFLSGCAARRVRIFLPQVSSPAAERAGLAFQGVSFQVLNGTPFSCRLIAGGKDLGVINAGELVFDRRYWHNLYSQVIPVAAVCYRDASPSEYVGAAGRLMVLGGNIPAEWTIRTSDIRTPDGRPLRATSAPTTVPTSRRIKLPREWWASSVGIQIINNTTEDITILVNGKPVAAIGTGGVDYVRAELVAGGYNRPLIITIVAGGCAYTETVWVQRYTQYARQIIFDAGLCGSRWR